MLARIALRGINKFDVSSDLGHIRKMNLLKVTSPKKKKARMLSDPSLEKLLNWFAGRLNTFLKVQSHRDLVKHFGLSTTRTGQTCTNNI